MRPVWESPRDFVEARVRVQTTPYRPSRVGALLAFLLGLAGCGGGSFLTPGQVSSLEGALAAQEAVRDECSDAGECKPSRVRMLERSAYCPLGGVLSALGYPPPDAGIRCPSGAK